MKFLKIILKKYHESNRFSLVISFLLIRNVPSSFKGPHGKIVYSLEACLSRSMRPDKKESTTVNFLSKADLSDISALQVGTTGNSTGSGGNFI